jgi:hypothetical protein
MRADNAHHLVAAAKRRRVACTIRVNAVIEDLKSRGGPMSVATVAAQAGVSRTFLYDPAQSELLARLRAVVADQPNPPRPRLPEQQRISSASHQRLVAALRERNKRLADENAQLRHELAVTLGHLRDVRRGQTATASSS